MSHIFDHPIPLGYAVAMVSRIQTSALKNRLTKFGITIGQLPFLSELLWLDTPITQDALSKTLFIDPAATARALEQLEAKGFVSRKVNPDNRRQKLVRATDKARWIKGELRAELRRSTLETLAPLTTEEQEQLKDLLEKVCLHHAAP